MHEGNDVMPAQKIALWADRLRDISASGLRFCTEIHDRENYQTVQDIAMEMLALATGESLQEIEPLRAPIFDRPSPIMVGDAAIVNGAGEILLIRRAISGRWATPGGAMSVGETPAEGVAREALEETGVLCRPVHLVGVYDNRLCGGSSRHHLYVFLFLCQLLDDGPPGPPSHASETLDMGWFAESRLPEPMEPSHTPRIRDAFRAWHGDRRTFFDATS
jgi:ADP-ribose pyrophosphatase YjhB (NUDIX family)